MKPIYIFDLDGTLALIEHRQWMVAERSNANWKGYYAACVNDAPNKPVIDVMHRLAYFADILIFSGRSDEVRRETEAWLCEHTHLMSGDVSGPMLTMRPAGNYTPDDQLKGLWLDNMLTEDRERIAAVFEDRDRMVAMWRGRGIPCFQVAPGDF